MSALRALEDIISYHCITFSLMYLDIFIRELVEL
jgi:hypothetical protein